MKRLMILAAACLLGCGQDAVSPSAGRAGEPSSAAEDPQLGAPIISTGELKRGMRGHALTVFEGETPEPVPVEVLSVLPNALGPKLDVILCRLKGPRIERTGVAQGMSGSPVFIEGRLAGAVALGWGFIKEPLCGVQPIEQMLRIRPRRAAGGAKSSLGQGRRGVDLLSTWARLRTGPVDEDVVTAFAGRLVGGRTGHEVGLTGGEGGGFRPLSLPILLSGGESPASRLLQRALAGTPLRVAAAGTAKAEAGPTHLAAGGVLGVPLIRGDLTAEVVGTATAVKGTQVFGFGHAFLGRGGVELPLSAGVIHAVVPSMLTSFKLASAGPIVGTLTSDETTGVYGRIGPKPKLIDFELSVRRRDMQAAEETLHMQMASHPQLTPLLSVFAVSGGVLAQAELPEEATVRYGMQLDLEGGERIAFENTVAGEEFPRWLMDVQAISAAMLNNPFRPVRIRSLRASAEVIARRDTAQIEEVWADHSVLAPGQALQVSARLRPYRGEPMRARLTLRLPDDLPEGTYLLEVCDWSVNAMRLLAERPYLLDPVNLKGMMDVIEKLAGMRRDRLYAHLVLPPRERVGLASRGEVWEDVPAVRGMVLAGVGGGPNASPLARPFTGALVATTEVPAVLSGRQVLFIHVQKDPK